MASFQLGLPFARRKHLRSVSQYIHSSTYSCRLLQYVLVSAVTMRFLRGAGFVLGRSIPRTRIAAATIISPSNQPLLSTAGGFSSLASRLKDPSLLKTQAFVAGEWADTGASFAVTDPATDEVICEVSACGPEHVETSVLAAKAAQKGEMIWANCQTAESGVFIRYSCRVGSALGNILSFYNR